MQYDFTKMQQRAKAKEAKQCYLNIQSQEQEYEKEAIQLNEQDNENI